MQKEGKENVNIKKVLCGMCGEGCGLKAHVREGDIVKIEGDSQNPESKGFSRMKGKAALEFHNHSDCLN